MRSPKRYTSCVQVPASMQVMSWTLIAIGGFGPRGKLVVEAAASSKLSSEAKQKGGL